MALLFDYKYLPAKISQRFRRGQSRNAAADYQDIVRTLHPYLQNWVSLCID
jgi:hypothetical protein